MAKRTKLFVNKGETKWIEVERLQSGTYGLMDENLSGHIHPGLAFSSWDDEVQCTHPDSCEMVLFDVSRHLQWNNVVMNLDSNEFHVNSLARLLEALAHVTFEAWDSHRI